MEKENTIFSATICRLIDSAERTNTLTEQCLVISQQIEMQCKFKEKMKGQLRYPVFVLVVFMGVFGLLLHEVLPEVIVFLSQGNAQMKSDLVYLVKLSDFIRQLTFLHIVAALVMGITLWVAIKAYFKNRIPNCYAPSYNLFWGQLLEQMADFIRVKIPLQSILGNASQEATTRYDKAFKIIREELSQGKPLENALETVGLNGNHASLIKFAGNQKSLELILRSLSKQYFDTQYRKIQTIINWTQPVLITTIGLSILSFAYSLLLPLYTYATHLN